MWGEERGRGQCGERGRGRQERVSKREIGRERREKRERERKEMERPRDLESSSEQREAAQATARAHESEQKSAAEQQRGGAGVSDVSADSMTTSLTPAGLRKGPTRTTAERRERKRGSAKEYVSARGSRNEWRACWGRVGGGKEVVLFWLGVASVEQDRRALLEIVSCGCEVYGNVVVFIITSSHHHVITSSISTRSRQPTQHHSWTTSCASFFGITLHHGMIMIMIMIILILILGSSSSSSSSIVIVIVIPVVDEEDGRERAPGVPEACTRAEEEERRGERREGRGERDGGEGA
eukprot:2411456-Rhodomonas_salina.1